MIALPRTPARQHWPDERKPQATVPHFTFFCLYCQRKGATACSPKQAHKYPYPGQQRRHTRSLQFLSIVHYPLQLDGRALRPSHVRGDSPRNAPLTPLLAQVEGFNVAQCNRDPSRRHRASAIPTCRRRAADTISPCVRIASRSRVRPAPPSPAVPDHCRLPFEFPVSAVPDPRPPQFKIGLGWRER